MGKVQSSARRRRRRRRRPRPDVPQLWMRPGRITVTVLSCLSSSSVTTLQDLKRATRTTTEDEARIHDAIYRIQQKFGIPIVHGYALAIGPNEPNGREIREWIRRNLPVRATRVLVS